MAAQRVTHVTHVVPSGWAQEGVQHAAQRSAGGGGGAMRRRTGGRALGGFPSGALSALLNWEPRAGPVLLMSLISINLMIEDVLNRITAYKIYPPATSFHFGRFAFFGAKTF